MGEKFAKFFEKYNSANSNSNALQRPWKHGSQPPMLINFLKEGLFPKNSNIYPLDASWNVDGLGHGCQSSFFDKNQCELELKQKVENGKILHWTGPYKPWYSSVGVPERKREIHGYFQQIWRKWGADAKFCAHSYHGGG